MQTGGAYHAMVLRQMESDGRNGDGLAS
jgi:hypothetical protein